MISIYELKPKFQNLLRPLVKKLANIGVTANQVTVFAMLLSIATGFVVYAFSTNHPLIFIIVPIVLFVRMALNAIDGMLAREHHMKSNLGNFLNELGDVISDTALYLPFLSLTGISAPLLLTVIFLSILSEMTGIMGVVIGATRRYDGPMGKSDRAFVFGVLAILFTCGISAGMWTSSVFVLIIILILLNIYFRIVRALREAKH
ncbi:CDP-alcohol phosphatidyltransferase family protein [Shimazuella kribbensis]|uniref:CDP-alcohol phosphatidyltransferase family protein n=1 Tax=Shimazuella kribbensis TaxID=139808 RepID=UPI000418743B|nr:CDP-alcohol phosphatidyltransferase family protein [Shimazuella kribbensis]